MGLRRQLPALQRHRRLRRRQCAAREIHFLLRECRERCFGQAEILRQQRRRRMSDPVGDAEGAEFGEVAVVEDQDEVTGLVAEALQHVAVAARKVPDVAGVEIVGLGEAAWIDDGGADAALENERPFGRGGVPVQLAHRAGLKPHRDAGDPLGDRQLRDGRLLAVTVADDLAVRLLQREFEGRQILARERRVRNIVHETRIATGGRLGRRAQRCQRGNACGGQKLPALRIGHGALPLRASEMLRRRRPRDRRRSAH